MRGARPSDGSSSSSRRGAAHHRARHRHHLLLAAAHRPGELAGALGQLRESRAGRARGGAARSPPATSQPPSSRFSVTVICGEQLAALGDQGEAAPHRAEVGAPAAASRRRGRPGRGAGSARRSPSAASSCRRRSARATTVRPGSTSRSRSRSDEEAAVAGAEARVERRRAARSRRRRHLVAEVGLDDRAGRARPRPASPSAIFRPWCSTITRSTWRSSVVTACSIQTTVRSSSSRRRCTEPRHRLDLASVRPAATSSSSSTRGRVASAMPISSRRCCDGVIVAPPAAPPAPSSPSRSRMLAASRSSAGAAGAGAPANSRPKATLSATDSAANTRGVWNVRAMPCAAKRCGAAPVRRRRRARTARPRSAPARPTGR